MPIFDVTKGAMRRELSRSFRDLVATSGSLANPTTTTFHAPELVFGAANDVVGGEVSFYQGGGASIANSERLIFSAAPYSPASPSLYGRVDALQPWSAAPSTNSGWEIHKLFKRQDYDDAIVRAIRRVARRTLLPRGEWLVANSWVRNPMFSTWSSGDTSAPDYWTLNGTGATCHRLTEDTWQGHDTARVRNATSQEAYFATDTIDMGKMAGKTVTLRVMCRTTSASRARMQLIDTGSGTLAQTDLHPAVAGNDGEGTWRELSIEGYTVPSTASNIQVRLHTSAGAALNVDWSKVLMDAGVLYEYDISPRFAYIQDIYMHDGTKGEWKQIPREWWFVMKEFRETAIAGDDAGRSRIAFLSQYFLPISNNTYRVVGQESPVDPGEGGNLPVDPEYVFNRAASDLHKLLPAGADDWRGWQAKAQEWENRAQELEFKTHTRPYPESKRVVDV